MSRWIARIWSARALAGFVSSKRSRQVTPSRSDASPKFRQMALAWPMCSCPFGSGGKRSTAGACAASRATIARMKLPPLSLAQPRAGRRPSLLRRRGHCINAGAGMGAGCRALVRNTGTVAEQPS